MGSKALTPRIEAAGSGNRTPGGGARAAFTLVELLLVMTVMIAAISVAGPSLANFFRGRTLDSEARRLLALTHAGQSRAVGEGVPMWLWVDVVEKSYGLKEAPGWDEQDPKEVEFGLDKDLKIEIVQAKEVRLVSARGMTLPVHQNTGTSAADPKEALPQIRFSPDGSIEEGSPQAVQLTDRDGVSVWVAQSRHGGAYEIRNQLE